jgi:hypothetical protein
VSLSKELQVGKRRGEGREPVLIWLFFITREIERCEGWWEGDSLLIGRNAMAQKGGEGWRDMR